LSTELNNYVEQHSTFTLSSVQYLLGLRWTKINLRLTELYISVEKRQYLRSEQSSPYLRWKELNIHVGKSSIFTLNRA